MSARFIVGDVRDVLAKMSDGSVDLIFTSPPFLALRSYLPADHPDKHREIGSEATPGAFIDTLLDLTEEWARVLTPYGSLVVELGDTYSGSGGAGGDYSGDGLRGDAPSFDGSARQGRLAKYDDQRGNPDGRDTTFSGANTRTGGGPGWPEAKSLCLIPESYRWALVYGRNPFTGRETPRWRARNVVRWCRPNPPVGSLGDKFRPATSELVVACKSSKRWFDLDAVRSTEPNPNTHARTAQGVESRPNDCKTSPDGNRASLAIQHLSAGAPPLDWWEIPTQPYAGSHYATFPERLCVRPIEAMCPREVCTRCGEPRRRITERTERYAAAREAIGDFNTYFGDNDAATGNNGSSRSNQLGAMTCAENVTVGWSDCGHGSYRRGVVLDPFAGSGTTLAVAEGLGRDSIGIDLDARNVDLALERCGMFLSIEDARGLAVVAEEDEA